MEEVWKDVTGYEGYYQVSNLGNVRSVTRKINYPDGHTQIFKGKPIRPHKTKYGYLLVGLNKNNQKKRKHVHDLVAEAFIDNPLELTEVNHKDHNKCNNRVDNLEWCTHQDNILDMIEYYYGVTPTTCVDCGKHIFRTSLRCRNCYFRYKKSNNFPPLSRDKLKELIRTMPIVSVGQLLHVTNTTIRNWCQKYHLPKSQKEIKAYTDTEWATI